MLKKEIYFEIAIVLALFILSIDHLNVSLSDRLLRLCGISPWTNGNTRFHIPVLIGFVLLIGGIVGAVKMYRPKYPRILSRIIIGCIAFIVLFPLASEQVMFLLQHNSTGINSLAYSMKNKECHFQTEEKLVKANCSVTLYNYGKVERVKLKPFLVSNHAEIEFKEQEFILQPHTKQAINVVSEGTQQVRTGFTGTTQEIGLQIEVVKEVHQHET